MTVWAGNFRSQTKWKSSRKKGATGTIKHRPQAMACLMVIYISRFDALRDQPLITDFTALM